MLSLLFSDVECCSAAGRIKAISAPAIATVVCDTLGITYSIQHYSSSLRHPLNGRISSEHTPFVRRSSSLLRPNTPSGRKRREDRWTGQQPSSRSNILPRSQTAGTGGRAIYEFATNPTDTEGSFGFFAIRFRLRRHAFSPPPSPSRSAQVRCSLFALEFANGGNVVGIRTSRPIDRLTNRPPKYEVRARCRSKTEQQLRTFLPIMGRRSNLSGLSK